MKTRFWRKHVSVPVARAMRHLTVRRIMWGGVFFILTTAILVINLLPQNLQLEEGQPSPQDFKAKQGIVYESAVLTEQAQEEAANQVKPVYEVDNNVLKGIEAELNTYFGKVRDIAGPETSLEEKTSQLEQALPFDKPDPFFEELARTKAADLQALQGDVLKIVLEAMQGGVTRDAIEPTLGVIEARVDNLAYPETLKTLAKDIIGDINIKPNLVYDAMGTSQRQAEARKSVGPVQVTIRQNEKIVGEGEIVTAADIEALQRLGLLRSRTPYFAVLGLLLFVLVSYSVVTVFIYFYNRDVFLDERRFILLGLLIVLTLLVAKAVTMINIGGRPEISMQVGYLAPVAAGSMLIAILLDNRLATFVTVILASFTVLMLGNQIQFFLVALIGGIVGVYSVSNLSQRVDLAKTSIYIVLANVLTIMAMGMMLNNSPSVLAVGAVMGFFGGVLSSVLTIGLLPFLETAFAITTSVKLVELSNPNQPLLRRLLLEAPGTYHHSVIVGNLAEAAANAVGADALLARVGAFYHDIGKIRRPYFFIENQLVPENPHDKLAPSLSTLIIMSHVKDGVEMAKEHNLPGGICDIIEQHHGSSLIAYFYHKAMENGQSEQVAEQEFRYETPQPRTKESAIVMLADSVEAAVRSLPKNNPARMEGFVRKVIKEKLEDGQLEECDLTFKELQTITQAFVRILSGIFHSRIEYPEAVLKEMERRKIKNGDPGFKSTVGNQPNP